MACSLERNQKGIVQSVLLEDGTPSQMFQQLNESAFIPSAEIAANITTGILDAGIQDQPLKYKDSKGASFDTMEELLISGERGMIAVTTADNQEIFSFNTEAGAAQMIADGIQLGFIQETKTLDVDGNLILKGKGSLTSTQKANAVFFAAQLKDEYGYSRAHAEENGNIRVGRHLDTILVPTSEGDTEVMTLSEAQEKKPESIAEVLDIVYKQEKKKATTQKATPQKIKEDLLSLLKNLGFSVTSLEAYRERYQTLYGKEPDIQAIADMANTVVAFAEGQDTLDNVAEEVAHVLLTMYNEKASLVEAMTEVAETEEYQEYADYYRGLYSKHLEGLQLEERVRLEILGKILAKKLSTSFAEESSLKRVWNRILEFLRERFKPSTRTTIDKINQDILNRVREGDLSKFEYDLSSSHNFFYSAMAPENRAIADKLLEYKDVLSSVTIGNKTASDYAKLEAITSDVFSQIEEALLERQVVEGMNTLIGITKRKMENLSREVSKLKPGERMPIEVLKLSQEVSSQLIPFMPSFKSAIENIKTESASKNDKVYMSAVKSLSSMIDNINTLHSEVNPRVEQYLAQRGVEFIQETYDGSSATEEEKQEDFDAFTGKTTRTDISKAVEWGGILSDSSHPELKLLHKIVSDMKITTVQKFQGKSKELLDKIKSGKFKEFLKFMMPKGSHYMFSPENEDASQEAIDNYIAQEVSNLEGIDIKEVQKRLKAGEHLRSLVKNEQDYVELIDRIQVVKSLHRNTPMKTEYYQQKADLHKRLGISSDTRSILKEYSERRAEIENKYRENGVIDKTKFTDKDIADLAQIVREKRQDASLTTSNGVFRDGIETKRVQDLSQVELKQFEDLGIDVTNYANVVPVIKQGQTRESLSTETRVAYEMAILNLNYAVQSEKGSPSQALNDRLRELQAKISNPATSAEGLREAREFMQANLKIGLSEEYYENLEDGTNFVASVRDYIPTIEDINKRDVVEKTLELYEIETNKKRELLRQNRKPNSYLEIDIENLPTETKDALNEIENNLSRLRRDINLPEKHQKKSGMETEVFIHRDFQKLVAKHIPQEEGLSEYEVALDNMSQFNRDKTRSFRDALSGIYFGNRTQFDNVAQAKFYAETLANKELIRDDMSNEEVFQTMLNEYAKARMSSYMRQVLPKGFKQTLDETFQNPEKAIEYLEGTTKAPNFLRLEPDYTWSQEVDNEEFKNPNFTSGEYSRHVSEQHLNDSWFQYWGISKSDYLAKNRDLSQLTPTRNQENWDVYTSIINTQKETLKLTGRTSEVSPYLKSQIRQSALEKLGNLFTNPASFTTQLKDSWQRLTTFTEEDLEYGDESNRRIVGSDGAFSVRNIPTYFQSKVEDPNMLSDDIISSSLLAHYEAIHRQEKQKHLGDAMAVRSRLARNTFVPAGISSKRKIARKGNDSNIAKKFDETVDFFFYGVKQSRQWVVKAGKTEIDLTKFLSTVQKYSSFTNLAFNPFVDITGATTGMLNNLITRLVGDQYTNESASWANTQAAKNIPSHLTEMGETNPTNQITMIMEAMGQYSVTERLGDSNKNKGAKVLQQTKGGAFLGSKLSNLALAPKLMYTNLKEYRYFSEYGKFMAFPEFYNQKKKETTLSDKEIKNLFQAQFDNSIFEHLDFSTGVLRFNEKFSDKFGDNAQTEFDNIFKFLSSRTNAMIQRVDGVISDSDRMKIQRDVLANSAMQHRGWFLINLSNRFKRGSFNLATNQWEEGHYRTVGNFIVNLVQSTREGLKNGETNVPAKFMEQLNKLSWQERKNLLRVTYESAALVALMAIGYYGIDFDDEEDTEAERFAKYIYLRTTSEFNTNNIFGIPGTVKEIWRSPVPSLRTLEFLQYWNPATWNDEYKGGVNRGKNKLWTDFKRNIAPLKRFDQLSDLQHQIQTYQFYNDPTLGWLGATQQKADKKERENDTYRESGEGVKIR